ncbi:MAG TPA: pitrilysin family protein [Thermoanaerobaculia bacterium]|nr:pitrilysin family protein [Thermoanaerobaculia bacterium]
MRIATLTALVCALLLPAAASAATGDVLPFPATEKTLPNGLKVIVVPTGFPNIVALYIPVQTGSRNEIEPGKSGFAHFFEHMMSRGTPAYPPEKYNEVVTKAGARENANTSDDRTVYHIVFAREDLPKIMEIYADRFMNLAYPEPAFQTESKAVLGEYNKNSASPVRKLLEVQRDHAFSTHTYKHTTMGFIKDIEDMPNQYAYSKEFFKRWYRPEYTTIIVAGDVKPDEVFALVDKYWSGWQRGTYKADIPQEPPAKGPVYAHVDWPSNTLPWVTVAFHGPAFSDTQKDAAAMSTLLDLEFGQTSDLYKRLVNDEQKVDQLFYFDDPHVDPSLYTVFARVKKQDDVPYVRDQIEKTFAGVRDRLEPADRVEEAKSQARYSLVRSLDNTEAVAETLAEFVKFNRSYNTINNFYRVQASLTPQDLQATAKRYFTNANLVVTTLWKGAGLTDNATGALPEPAAQTGTTTAPLHVIKQKSLLPQIETKLLFNVGSANDPAGKEGLAVLASDMIADAGSRTMTIDAIRKALYPMAGAFYSGVDKEMTTLTASIHKDNWEKFFDIVLPQLLEPGFRDEDFQRLKDAQLNALKESLRNNNEEELGKEELQNRIYAGTPYGHTALGTVAGIQAITLDDVKKFIAANYTRNNLIAGVSGDFPDALIARLNTATAQLPEGSVAAQGLKALPKIEGHKASGLEVEIIQKDTRATAISIGAPLPLTRASGADWAALNVARAWLGEHRMSQGRLFQRLREIRGLNYGDYSYIEYFNRPGGQFFPSPNIARRSQIFEIWIRPVVPANAHMSLRIALHELDKLVNEGLSQADFDATRQYLMKNAYVMTATQDQRLGYDLDSWWYGIPEYTSYVRNLYSKLTRDDVNRALKTYLTPANLNVVIVTKDAQGLRDALVSDAVSTIKYDSPKPDDIMAEDKVIGAMKLNIKPENVKIVPVDDVFAK